MARTRTIKPEFWDDEKLANVSRDARLTFVGFWMCSDDYGVTKGNPKWLKSKIFPYDSDIKNGHFEKWLKELEGIDCIIPFEAHGESYYLIKSFNDYQKIDHPSKMRNPEPPRKMLAKLSRNPRSETETETETETEI